MFSQPKLFQPKHQNQKMPLYVSQPKLHQPKHSTKKCHYMFHNQNIKTKKCHHMFCNSLSPSMLFLLIQLVLIYLFDDKYT